MQFSIAVRNAQMLATSAAIGGAPIIRMFTGPAPADCAAPDSGTLLAEGVLAAAPFLPPAGGALTAASTVLVPVVADGALGHYRIYDSTGATCHEQGSVTVVGGGGDMELETVDAVAPKVVRLSAKVITAGNA